MKVPFEEVAFIRKDNNVVILAPWVQVTVSLNPNEQRTLLTILEHPYLNFKANIFQDLLTCLEDFELFYDAPRESLHPTYSRSFLRKQMIPNYTLSQDNPININSLISKCIVAQKGIDPISLYQLLRKENLLFDHTLRKKYDVYAALIKIKKEIFFKQALSKVLNQIYYITYNFPQLVHPKLFPNSPMLNFIEELYYEEIGHHKLILESLRSLEEEPEEKIVLDSIKMLLKLLQYALKHSPVGFALIISNLEGSYYPEEDPLCKVIEGSLFAKAGEGIKKHFEINKKGNHKDFSLRMVRSLNTYLSEQEATMAIYILESLNTINYLTDKNLVDYINKHAN